MTDRRIPIRDGYGTYFVQSYRQLNHGGVKLHKALAKPAEPLGSVATNHARLTTMARYRRAFERGGVK